ncbi:MAG: glycogen debranching protein [Cyclobacteriaceae bacterium]
MKIRLIYILIMLFSLTACNKEKENNVLYSSEEFTLYSDRVVQDNNTAVVESPSRIRSNYKSKETENYSRRIQFKFSINKKDNELPSGKNHWLMISNDEHESPVIEFGADAPEDPAERLPVNYQYTFRLDMRPVLSQFREKGYYEAFDGSRITESEFKNVYIAGGSEPLTWDFSNLDNNGLALEDPDGDGIYELTVILNPYNPDDYKEKTWELSMDLSDKPRYKSDQPIVDALFNMSLEEAVMNIEPDSTLRTGAKWGGVWTRDVSYSILLAFAYHEPEVAKISLMRKVTPRKRIIQDTGSGGAYPVSSDRTTWALAAWEIYKTTGDHEWLEKSYEILKNTLDDDYENLRSSTGMYRGESSFNRDIYVSQNLGTNAVHYQAHVILTKMAGILNKPGEVYQTRAEMIKAAINEQLWMEDKGYYAQYLYGRKNLSVSPRFEALGEALTIIFDIASEEQSRAIIENSPVTAFGTTCIYPQIPGIPPYHNNGIWPFVQSYWNWSAAKAGNETVLEHGLASVYRAGALFLTNYENFVADNGDFMGTEINSHRMLWSMAGNLAMVHRIDGTAADPFFPADLTGEHRIDIQMANNDFSGKINEVPNKFSLANPVVTYENGIISWDPVEGASSFSIIKDGSVISTTEDNSFQIDPNIQGEYQVMATDGNGLSSFLSIPVYITGNQKVIYLEFERFNPSSDLLYSNFNDSGFVETSLNMNTNTELVVNTDTPGEYIIDFRYSNGTGPWNTDNNCAMRTLYVNGEKTGVIVMPQRGTDEWSDWGNTNSFVVKLNEGPNRLSLKYDDWNVNMDGEINKAMLDQARLIKLK